MPCNKYYYTRSGVDDLSDEELDDESEELHYQDSDNNEATCTKLLLSTEKAETNSEANSIDNSSNASPVVSDEKTENDNKSTPLPEISKDERKDENITEVNGSSSEDNKPPVENTTTPTIDTFEVS